MSQPRSWSRRNVGGTGARHCSSVPESPWFQMTTPFAFSGPCCSRSQKPRSSQKKRLPGGWSQARSASLEGPACAVDWTTRGHAASTAIVRIAVFITGARDYLTALRLVFAPDAVSAPTRRLSVAPARRQHPVSERHGVIEDGLRMMRPLAPHHQLDPYVLCDVLFGEPIRERRGFGPFPLSTRNSMLERPVLGVVGGNYEIDLIAGP